MRVTYYALREIKVGDTVRQPGELVPEAAEWPFLSGYVHEGQLAPVLVATLPQKYQEVLAQWESDQRESVQNAPVAAPQAASPGDGNTAAAKSKPQKEKV